MEKLKLIGFDLEEIEKEKINNILNNYLKKIENIVDYKQLSIRLKKSKHGKIFLHEIETKLETKEKIFNSKITDYNIFNALKETLKKIINELKHYYKK
ncbi:MAG: hypothetical protein QW117_01350 [Candidatus Pacearchaeota archaeon]